jgi:hypothetical protein
MWRVFTARYALSPYIKQIHFVFKGLISLEGHCRKRNASATLSPPFLSLRWPAASDCCCLTASSRSLLDITQSRFIHLPRPNLYTFRINISNKIIFCVFLNAPLTGRQFCTANVFDQGFLCRRVENKKGGYCNR